MLRVIGLTNLIMDLTLLAPTVSLSILVETRQLTLNLGKSMSLGCSRSTWLTLPCQARQITLNCNKMRGSVTAEGLTSLKILTLHQLTGLGVWNEGNTNRTQQIDWLDLKIYRQELRTLKFHIKMRARLWGKFLETERWGLVRIENLTPFSRMFKRAPRFNNLEAPQLLECPINQESSIHLKRRFKSTHHKIPCRRFSLQPKIRNLFQNNRFFSKHMKNLVKSLRTI